MRRFLKTWMLPLSMIGGVLFHEWIGYIKFLTPYLIFTMLFFTFLKVTPKEMRISKFHWSLLVVQLVGCWAVYYATLWIGPIVAQGVFICVLISTATSAPVITGMLGGSISRLATYSLLSNMTFAVVSPVFISFITHSETIPFMAAFQKICSEVLPLILIPFVAALFLRYSLPKVHKRLVQYQSVSFYLWAVALFIVVGNSVSFVMKQPLYELTDMLWLAVGSLIVCCAQFLIGRRIGSRYGDKVSGAQGLGQKNTILAIWVAMTYLNPLSSVAPAAYVAWQNIINSSQLYFKQKRDGAFGK